MVCNLLPKGEDRNSVISYFIIGNNMYEFRDEQTKEGLLNYLSSANWEKSTVIISDFEDYGLHMLGTRLSCYEKSLRAASEFNQWLE